MLLRSKFEFTLMRILITFGIIAIMVKNNDGTLVLVMGAILVVLLSSISFGHGQIDALYRLAAKIEKKSKDN